MTGQAMYTFSCGVKIRCIMKAGQLVFDKRLIFPDDDFRVEYRGDLNDDQVMNGNGTLFVVGGTTYTAEWKNGISKHSKVLQAFQSEHLKVIKTQNQKKAKAEEAKKDNWL